MRELARFVAEAKSFAARMEKIGGRLPSPDAAPFLYRQMERTLLQVYRSIVSELPDIAAKMIPVDEDKGGGLMNRVRKTFSRRRDGDREDIKKDIEESLDEGLQGNTWTVPIPDLLAFLSTGRKTGVLWVHDAQETFLLQLDEGTLVHATSDGNPDRMRLGEVLVHLGKITSEDLEAFLGSLGPEAGFLGAELVDAGMIQESDLTDALTFQIQEMFRRLLASRSSIFRFQEGIRLMSRKDVHLNVQSVLLDVLREADELNKALSALDDDLEESFLGGLGAELGSELVGKLDEVLTEVDPPAVLPAEGSPETAAVGGKGLDPGAEEPDPDASKGHSKGKTKRHAKGKHKSNKGQ